MRRPLTDIIKSYITLLISLLPWPSPFLQNQLQLCVPWACSDLGVDCSDWRLNALHFLGVARFVEATDSKWCTRWMWHQPLVSNWSFWSQQTEFMVAFLEPKRAEWSQDQRHSGGSESRVELNVGLQLMIFFFIISYHVRNESKMSVTISQDDMFKLLFLCLM